jgi:hypothetical protein
MTSLPLTAEQNLKPLMAQGLHMGDELHNRNAAASAMLFKRLVLVLGDLNLDSGAVQRALKFCNDHFFLNVSMAACKSMTDAAHGGTRLDHGNSDGAQRRQFRHKLNGTGDAWFETRANPVDGLYFPGYSVADAAADLGNSAITETNGSAVLRWRLLRRSYNSWVAPQRTQPRTANGCSVLRSAATRLYAAGSQFRRDAR